MTDATKLYLPQLAEDTSDIIIDADPHGDQEKKKIQGNSYDRDCFVFRAGPTRKMYTGVSSLRRVLFIFFSLHTLQI